MKSCLLIVYSMIHHERMSLLGNFADGGEPKVETRHYNSKFDTDYITDGYLPEQMEQLVYQSLGELFFEV